MTERSLLFVMKPSSWILTESGYCNIFSSHPWTLIVQRLAVCFDVPERIERAPVFPHNWMIFAFILCVEEKGAQQWCYMRQYKMNSRHARGDCKYRWNACLYTHARTRTHTHIYTYTENDIFIVINLFHFTEGTKAQWLAVHFMTSTLSQIACGPLESRE